MTTTTHKGIIGNATASAPNGSLFYLADMEKANLYAVITAEVRYDKNLSASEKLFYAEITALTQVNGKCYASNGYFAKLYGVGRSTISLWIANLAKQGYVDVEYEYNGKQVSKRHINIVNPSGIHLIGGGQNSEHVVRKSEGGGQKIERGWSENRKENNTLTESNNTLTESNRERKRFIAPTVDEVCAVMGNMNESEKFVDYYTSIGWMIGKSPMKDWKSAVRNWKRRQNLKEEKTEVRASSNFWKPNLDADGRRIYD